MKKTYIIPALTAVKLNSTLMQQVGSLGKNNEIEVETQMSNKYQGGFLWEDNETEAQ